MLAIRDRVKDFRRVPASSLRPSKFNWRTHPENQKSALRAVLARIGFAGAELTRELPDGSLELIDGHARAEEMGDNLIPVLVTDLSEQEAKELLAVYDPIGDLATADAAKLEDLLASIDLEAPALLQLCDELAAKHLPQDEPAADEPAGEDAIPEKYQILIECPGEAEQAKLLEELAGRGLKVRSLIS